MKQSLFAVSLLLVTVFFCVSKCRQQSSLITYAAGTVIISPHIPKPQKNLVTLKKQKTKTIVQPKQKERIDPAGIAVQVDINDTLFDAMIRFINKNGVYQHNYVHTYLFKDKNNITHTIICTVTVDSLGNIPVNEQDLLVKATVKKKDFLYVIQRDRALLCTQKDSHTVKIVQDAVAQFIMLIKK